MSSNNVFSAANWFGFGANVRTIVPIGDSPQQQLLRLLSAATVTSEMLSLKPMWSSAEALQSLAAYKLQDKAKKNTFFSENLVPVNDYQI